MDRRTLDSELADGASYAAWLATLSRYFAAHELVFGHGTDNAADEAFWLLKHLLEWRDMPPETEPDRRLARDLADLAERRVAERVPMAYLLGEAWFAGLPFKVDPRVLIPRSPLAEIIEARFAPWCRLGVGDRILDIGTGSGCLAVASAVYCPETRVDATDVSGAALAVAAENVARHGVGDRVRLLRADLFPRGRERYRVIISNPPYVPAPAVKALPPEYGHEPAVALDGGPSGLESTERILRDAGRFLTPDGILLVEVGAEAPALMAAHPRLPVTWIELERGGDGVFVITADELKSVGEWGPAGASTSVGASFARDS
jgi:ribosomal protein L3 glutamine methyltransferase